MEDKMGHGHQASMVFNILIKKEGDLLVAHCLELDVVTTGNSYVTLTKEMSDLLIAQIKYAFENNNLENLYHPAPPDVWKQFYECKPVKADTVEVKFLIKNKLTETFVPPWIIANTCFAEDSCLAK
jgi:hypothetical protein